MYFIDHDSSYILENNFYCVIFACGQLGLGLAKNCVPAVFYKTVGLTVPQPRGSAIFKGGGGYKRSTTYVCTLGCINFLRWKSSTPLSCQFTILADGLKLSTAIKSLYTG